MKIRASSRCTSSATVLPALPMSSRSCSGLFTGNVVDGDDHVALTDAGTRGGASDVLDDDAVRDLTGFLFFRRQRPDRDAELALAGFCFRDASVALSVFSPHRGGQLLHLAVAPHAERHLRARRRARRRAGADRTRLAMSLPSNLTIMSPGSIPALAAGLSFWTEPTSAPLGLRDRSSRPTAG